MTKNPRDVASGTFGGVTFVIQSVSMAAAIWCGIPDVIDQIHIPRWGFVAGAAVIFLSEAWEARGAALTLWFRSLCFS